MPQSNIDPHAEDLTEDRRFPFCSPEGLIDLSRRAGLALVDCVAIEMPTVFKDFDDYWQPFTLGAGPAPGYCISLDPQARQRLKEKLRDHLPPTEDGSISLKTKAWAVRAKVG